MHRLDLSQSDLAQAYNDLGLVYQRMKSYKGALKMLQEASRVEKRRVGSRHVHAARRVELVARLHFAFGFYNKAAESFQEVLDFRRARFGENHLDVANSLEEIGLVYSKKGNYDKAIASFLGVAEIRSLNDRLNHLSLARAYFWIGDAFRKQNQKEDAIVAFGKVVKLYHSVAADLKTLYCDLLPFDDEISTEKEALSSHLIDVTTSIAHICSMETMIAESKSYLERNASNRQAFEIVFPSSD